jgi:2-keto-4-pentenoate hydratase
LDGAYRNQRAQGASRHRKGYKLGLLSRAKQSQMGLTTPIYGQVFDSMLLESPVLPNRFIAPRVEPELAVVLRHALPAGAAPGAASRAVAGAFLALDILDSVWRDFRFSAAEVIADNASS